jgi:hypothetical protein
MDEENAIMDETTKVKPLSSLGFYHNHYRPSRHVLN